MRYHFGKIHFESYYQKRDDLLDDLFYATKNSDSLIYRGISVDDQRYPGILREEALPKDKLPEIELRLLEEFRKYCASLISGVSTLDFITCAQHYGLPTRLLDWSYDPFVALYFALARKRDTTHKNNRYRILVCDREQQIAAPEIRHSLKPSGTIKADNRIEAYRDFRRYIQSYDAQTYREENRGRFVVLAANDSNPRINAQRGLFVVPKALSKKAIDAEYKSAGVCEITIAPRARKYILDTLKKLGYEKRRLFFDLQNVCEAIRENLVEDYS